MNAFRRGYGAGPLHLIAMAASFAVAIYAGIRLFATRPVGTAVWFAGSAVLHDLVVLPVYVLIDTALVVAWRGRPSVAGVTWLNHLRFPAAISVLLLVMFSPEIFGKDGPYYGDSDLSSAGYLGRWGMVAGVLFALSLLAFAVRAVRAVRSRRTPDDHAVVTAP